MPAESVEPIGPLTVERQRAVFAAIVAAQDGGASVAASRASVGLRYQVTVSQARAIEREGVEKGWPPL